MTETLKRQLERMGNAPLEGEPDYEAMWSRVENKLGENNLMKRNQRGFSRHKKTVLTLAASVAIMAAVPVWAAVNGGWDNLWNGRSSVTAIEQGLGERLNQTVTNGGIPLTLNGVATDDQQMNMLLTMNMTDLPAYDAVAFEKAELWGENNKLEQVQVQLRSEPEQGRLYGLASAKNTLGSAQKSYRLALENLIFYRYRSTPLKLDPSESEGEKTMIANQSVNSVEVTSVIREGNVFSIRYKLGAESEAAWKTNPHLTLLSGGKEIEAKYAAVLPSDDPAFILRQSNYELSDEALKGARFELTALEESGRKPGTWSLSFGADGRKAAQAMLVKQLDPAEVANDSFMKFTELIVTPLEIRLMYQEDRGFPTPDHALVSYDTVKLVMNGKEMDSGAGFLTTKDGGFYRRFELPQWYEQEDWGRVPMQVVLSGKQVQAQADKDHLLTLTQPSADRKTVKTELHGAPVAFTYYKEGNDLLVESSSSEPAFGGITQSYLSIKGERQYPQMNPTPPGGNGTNRKIERYVSVPEGDLILNPFLYRWLDPEARVELNLR